MQVLIFSVFDKVTGAYMQPMFQLTRAQAVRTFGDAVKDKESIFNKHPEDYALYELGFFDDTDGDVAGNVKPEFVVNATDFVEGWVNG